jgi:hypothetical protein
VDANALYLAERLDHIARDADAFVHRSLALQVVHPLECPPVDLNAGDSLMEILSIPLLPGGATPTRTGARSANTCRDDLTKPSKRSTS